MGVFHYHIMILILFSNLNDIVFSVSIFFFLNCLLNTYPFSDRIVFFLLMLKNCLNILNRVLSLYV